MLFHFGHCRIALASFKVLHETPTPRCRICRQILLAIAHLVVGANDPALQETPERFNRLKPNLSFLYVERVSEEGSIDAEDRCHSGYLDAVAQQGLRIEKRRGGKPEQSPGPLRARIVRKEG
jgi:hypothetical protein